MNSIHCGEPLVLLAFHRFLKNAVCLAVAVATCCAIYKKGKRKGRKKDGRARSIAGTKRRRKMEWTERQRVRII